MKKTKLSYAIALSLGIATSSANAIDVDVTNMNFDGTIFAAEGQLRDDADDMNIMQSVDTFFGNPWSAVGVAYFEAGNQTPIMDNDAASDEANVTNGAQPASWGVFSQTSTFDVGSNMYTWEGMSVSGKDGVQRPFSYTFPLNTGEVAWGTLFNWNDNQAIPVLNVMDCTNPAACVGVPGTPMVNGPFSGSDPLFNGGLPPMSCVDSFQFNLEGAFDINIADSLSEACSNAQGPVTLVSIGMPTSGTATEDGTNITYTPPSNDFTGTDDFPYTATDGIVQSSADYLVQIGGELQNNFSMMDRSGKVFGGTNDVDIVWDETSFNMNTLDANGSPTDTTFGLMTIGSPEPFFNFTWVAHNVRIFNNNTASAITYNFDVTCEKSDYDAGIVDCDKPLSEQGAKTRFITMTLEPGEIGGHILFDWGKNDSGETCGKANCDIDVVNKWSAGKWDKHGATGEVNVVWIGPAGVPPATVENAGEGNQANWVLISGDVNGDGINASPMIDGAFEGSYANFNYKPDAIGTALPPFTGEISDVDVDGFSFSFWTLFTGLFSVLGLRRLQGKK